LGSSIDRKFSYCLLPFESNTTSKLNFGDAAVVSGDGVVSTPIVRKDLFSFYILTLEAFSVGNKRVDITGSPMDVEGNIIIDSGTTLSFLPSDVYAKLKYAMVESVNLKRVDDPITHLTYAIVSHQMDIIFLLSLHILKVPMLSCILLVLLFELPMTLFVWLFPHLMMKRRPPSLETWLNKICWLVMTLNKKLCRLSLWIVPKCNKCCKLCLLV
jgi:hypothetical protein